MRRAGAAIFALVFLVSATRAADDPADLKSVLKEYQAAQGEIIKAYRATEMEAEKQKLLARYRKLPLEFADKFLAVAEKDPKGGASFEAAAWVVANAGETPAADKALAILLKEHVKSDKIGRACLQAAQKPSAVGTKLARAVLENGPNDTAKGQACYALASILTERSEQAFQKKKPDESARLAAEAEKLLELVQEKFADVTGLDGDTLGAQAKSDLYDLRNLAVGKTVPEIEGEDIDGKKFKLSDYRGKVVLVDFWGHWCGPCRAAYPHNRDLIKRLEDKPFVLLGVNSDDEKDTIKKAMAKEENTWRYWFDGGKRGPIAKKFNVQGWPTFYLIDHKGVIRMRSVGAPDHADLDKALEELLAEAKSK
jgi:thiol-disulfide isomerase/thioredoxin